MAEPIDPTALFRQFLGQWEQAANQMGGDLLKSDGFARAMHGGSAATMQAREAMKAAADRALAAANMPSRDEVSDLSARLARIEETLARIEAAVTAPTSVSTPGGDRPRPRRTRTPPAGG